MLGNRSPWLGQVQLVKRSWMGQPIDTSYPNPPPQAAIMCKAGAAECPSAFCLTIGPVSTPDLKKVKDQLQAQQPGKFWLYPRTAMGPGDQDYVVWCNAYATPVQGSVVWTPPAGLVSEPTGTPGASTGPSVPAPGAAPSSASPTSGTALAVGGGLAAAGLLAFLAFR